MSSITSWPYVLGAIAGLAASTVFTRASFSMAPASFQLPERVERALRYAPGCALVGIIAPNVFTRDHELFLSWHNNQMWALLAGSLVFAKTRNMLAMMTVGLALFTALRLWT